MVIDRKARIADRAQHRIAQFGAVIELIAIGGLEQQPAEADRLHQEAIARLDGVIVNMVRDSSLAIPRRAPDEASEKPAESPDIRAVLKGGIQAAGAKVSGANQARAGLDPRRSASRLDTARQGCGAN